MSFTPTPCRKRARAFRPHPEQPRSTLPAQCINEPPRTNGLLLALAAARKRTSEQAPPAASQSGRPAFLLVQKVLPPLTFSLARPEVSYAVPPVVDCQHVAHLSHAQSTNSRRAPSLGSLRDIAIAIAIVLVIRYITAIPAQSFIGRPTVKQRTTAIPGLHLCWHLWNPLQFRLTLFDSLTSVCYTPGKL